jgi:hypothetical protein
LTYEYCPAKLKTTVRSLRHFVAPNGDQPGDAGSWTRIYRLALKATEWWKSSAAGAVLLILGTLICGYGQAVSQRWAVVAGFAAMLAALAAVYLKHDSLKK